MDTGDWEEGEQMVYWRRGEGRASPKGKVRWAGPGRDQGAMRKAQGPSTGTAPWRQNPAAIDWRGLSGPSSRPQDW